MISHSARPYIHGTASRLFTVISNWISAVRNFVPHNSGDDHVALYLSMISRLFTEPHSVLAIHQGERKRRGGVGEGGFWVWGVVLRQRTSNCHVAEQIQDTRILEYSLKSQSSEHFMKILKEHMRAQPCFSPASALSLRLVSEQDRTGDSSQGKVKSGLISWSIFSPPVANNS
ncbi:MAG: hypothetical protein FE78DRAFT_314792 [Acidomyces sp. 'richmondensis']|nr:MAG: hypothetical protein FE78DRAFT_314792 [Acidomyces sp. 'richmondensis']